MSRAGLMLAVVLLSGCGGIKQYQQVQQPLGETLRTHVGGTIVRIDHAESLPNAFGGADVWGGKRPTGVTELKYLGAGANGAVKLRVVSTDITTNENWRRRMQRQGYATSTSDAVDFEHDPAGPFEMEGYVVQFVEVAPSALSYRIQRRG